MVFKHTTFNHDAENFFEALNLDDEMMNLCKERVFFTTFTNALNVSEWFDSVDDAPSNIKTVTGDFEKCLNLIEDQKEYEYTLMIFHKTHDLAIQCFKRYSLHELAKNDKKEAGKKVAMVKLLDLLTELKMHNEEDEGIKEGILNGFTPKGLMKRIEYTKNCQGSFQVYLNMVDRYKRQNNPNVDSADPAVNDILKNLFSSDEDDD